MRTHRPAVLAVVVAALVILAAPARAAPAAPVDVPDALRPWIPWVLHGAERDRCPTRTDGNKVCESPGRLELVVDKAGGTFAQSWRVDAAGLAVLPGDARHWPVDVVVD